MPHIAQLDTHVADLISAGEVVERPASVVKELVENAIDAGASAVVVEIQRGGMGLIRVTDNGCGIAPEELPTAFLRHATSKLRSAEDLGCIETLGFRGEALAAISAVSRVDILTRPRGAGVGASLHLEGGEPAQIAEAGAPEGTTIVVRDLFYNTPARLKFMRKDTAETAAVAGLIQHLALSHPDVSFQFVKDHTDALHTPGDGRLDSAIYAALGRDFARGLVGISGRSGDLRVDGFVTAPLMGRGSRAMQIFFVNGRFIKSQLLTAALEEGYRNQIMKGKFPGCVLSVTLPANAVDVNVHPAKTQIKFAREREVFDAVYHTVLDALSAEGSASGRTLAPGKGALDAAGAKGVCPEEPNRAGGPAAPHGMPAGAPVKKDNFFQTVDARTFRTQRISPTPAADRGGRDTAHGGWNTERGGTARVADSGSPAPFYRAEPSRNSAFGAPESVVRPRPSEETPETAAHILRGGETAEAPAPAPQTAVCPASPASPRDGRMPVAGADAPARQLSVLPEEETPWRIVGEVLHTYIICEDASGTVWLIDKHAAHERINFDRLKAAAEPPMRQTLLEPVAAALSREDCALVLEQSALLEQLGFSCEDFGDGTLLVREVPADLDAADTAATLEELAQCLRTGRSPEEKRENLLHTIACKAAIKGGWVSDAAEERVLVEQVQSGAIQYCPHGRPVAVKLTKYELEKMFKRA